MEMPQMSHDDACAAHSKDTSTKPVRAAWGTNVSGVPAVYHMMLPLPRAAGACSYRQPVERC
jgi:hypothetical protein